MRKSVVLAVFIISMILPINTYSGKQSVISAIQNDYCISPNNDEVQKKTLEEVIINNRTELPIKAIIEDNILKLKSVPNDKLYNYFHIQIYPSDYSSDAIYDISARSNSKEYSFQYDLADFKDGGYHFTIRTAETEGIWWDWSHLYKVMILKLEILEDKLQKVHIQTMKRQG